VTRGGRIGFTILALVCAACDSDGIVEAGGGSRRIDARVGDTIDVLLFAGALGLYASPPTISTADVMFVDMTLDAGAGGFVSPGGPTQRFRFRAASHGTAIVTFSPIQNAPVVVDTIVVR
jgi:hypothetical protein